MRGRDIVTDLRSFADEARSLVEGDRVVARTAADEIEALREIAHEEHIDKWNFDTLLYVGRRMLEEYYPPSVFDGSSGDSGPQYVVALREAIKRIDEQRS